MAVAVLLLREDCLGGPHLLRRRRRLDDGDTGSVIGEEFCLDRDGFDGKRGGRSGGHRNTLGKVREEATCLLSSSLAWGRGASAELKPAATPQLRSLFLPSPLGGEGGRITA